MPKQINLDGMHERHRALTQPIAGGYREAAAVCLNRHHSPPVEITLVDNGKNALANLTWVEPDARISAAWANDIDATEAGAYGCVIAGVEFSRGLFAVRRAETGTGADYYIGLQGSGDDLENCLRLEVSGVSSGTSKDVSRRLMEKVRQTLDGNSNLPALAGVVGFSARMLVIQDVEGEA
jgi:hypothetical protein